MKRMCIAILLWVSAFLALSSYSDGMASPDSADFRPRVGRAELLPPDDPAGAPPIDTLFHAVDVWVTKQSHDGDTTYVFVVRNRSPFRVGDLWIGMDPDSRDPEVPMTGDGVPESSATSPAGWLFRGLVSELGDLGYLWWDTEEEEQGIPPGCVQGGFTVRLPAASGIPGRLGWVAHVWSSEMSFYAGRIRLADGSVTGTGSGEVALLGAEDIRVEPNPGLHGVRIRYRVRHEVETSLEIFDVMGRRRARIVVDKPRAGWNTLQWDGTDDRHARVDPGVYYLRIINGLDQRFARCVLVR